MVSYLQVYTRFHGVALDCGSLTQKKYSGVRCQPGSVMLNNIESILDQLSLIYSTFKWNHACCECCQHGPLALRFGCVACALHCEK
jgi:hypothetical protein